MLLRFALVLVLSLFNLGSSISAVETKPKPPNILLILVDDLGYGDLSSFGASDLSTPAIDSLVRDGTRMDQFYANCPVCSPTRAALLTGRFQDLVGVPGVIRTHANNSWGYLHPKAKLLSSVLKKGGYQTAIIGKWHLGLESPNTPTERGFDFFHGFLGDMMDDYYHHRRHGRNYMRKNREVIQPKGHATDLFSEWAVDYLKAYSSDKPFFLYLSYNAPHTPIQPPKDWLQKYRIKRPQVTPKRARLASFIEHMDHGIGKVLKTLKESGYAKNTLVVFTSDNGGQVNVGARNGAVRDGKGSLYEGGLKVPMVVRWPGNIPKGNILQQVALSMDLFPTLAEAAGVSFEHSIEGRSLLKLLKGKQHPWPDRDLFFGRREGGRKYQGKAYYCYRRGSWKLLQPEPGAKYELYDLSRDPLEQNDLAVKEKDRFIKMMARMEKQLEAYAKVPWRKPTE